MYSEVKDVTYNRDNFSSTSFISIFDCNSDSENINSEAEVHCAEIKISNSFEGISDGSRKQKFGKMS